MKLIAQQRDGSRITDAANFYSYKHALDAAGRHLGNLGAVACYLQADHQERFVRTYTRDHFTGETAVAFGYHPVLEPPTMYPGSLPSPAHLDFAEIEGRIITHMLAEADRKGYARGFKVGIAHRNRERAGQLRRQADALERIADHADRPRLYGYQEGAVEFAMRAHQMGKTWSLEEAHQARDRLRRFTGLPNSVREGVWGTPTGRRTYPLPSSRRPEFSVDLGHNRR